MLAFLKPKRKELGEKGAVQKMVDIIRASKNQDMKGE